MLAHITQKNSQQTMIRFTESLTVRTRAEKKRGKVRVDGTKKFNKRLNRRNQPRSHHGDRRMRHKENVSSVRLESTLEQFEYQIDYFSDYDEYSYDYDRYDSEYYNDYDHWGASSQWNSEAPERPQCVICCRDFYVDQLCSQPFDKSFSFKQALLTPRPQITMPFTSDFTTRYVIKGEKNSCLECLVSHLSSVVKNATAYSLNLAGLPGLSGSAFIPLEEVSRILHEGKKENLVLRLETLMLKASVVAVARADSSPSANWRFPSKNHVLPVDCVSCENMFVVDVSQSRCTHVACSSCKADICFICRSSFHWGTTCDQSSVLKNELTRGCPACFVAIEKNGGCNHMMCTHCNTHFQWPEAKSLLDLPARFKTIKSKLEVEDDESTRQRKAFSVLVTPAQRCVVSDSKQRSIVGCAYRDARHLAQQRRRRQYRLKLREQEKQRACQPKATAAPNTTTKTNTTTKINTTKTTSIRTTLPVYMTAIQI